MMESKKSTAINFIETLYRGASKNISWVDLNSSLRETLHLAIKVGLKFDINDFTHISNNFGFHYWNGETVGENFYVRAIEYKNMSAIKAFEAWKNRAPFVMANVTLNGKERKKDRLAIGSEFKWNDEEVKVTSFSPDGLYLTACAYHKQEYDERGWPLGPLKIKSRYKLTPVDLKAETKFILAFEKIAPILYRYKTGWKTRYFWLSGLVENTWKEARDSDSYTHKRKMMEALLR